MNTLLPIKRRAVVLTVITCFLHLVSCLSFAQLANKDLLFHQYNATTGKWDNPVLHNTANKVFGTDGSGNWGLQNGGSLTNATSVTTGFTNGQLLFNNNGVLGGDLLTDGSGNLTVTTVTGNHAGSWVGSVIGLNYGGFGTDVSGVSGFPYFTAGSLSFVSLPLPLASGGLGTDLSAQTGLLYVGGGSTSFVSLPLSQANGGFGSNVSASTGIPYFFGNGTCAFYPTSTGGNGNADAGLLAKYGSNGNFAASGILNVWMAGSTTRGIQLSSISGFNDSITFLGANGGTPQTQIQITTPTANRTITLPDATGTVMLGSQNLSGLTNTTTARTNLGLGSAATLTAGTAANNVVQLDGSGNLPALNGSALTSLNASNISSGTLADARHSANIPLLNGAQTFSANNTFSSQFILSGRADATIAADQNNWAPTGATTATEIFVDGGAADRNITGMAGGTAGRILGLTNKGTTNSIVLKNANGSSTANNQFAFANGQDVTLPPGGAIELRYDGTASLWRSWGRAMTNTGVTAATYGSATQSSQVTVDVAGRVTNASNVTVTPAVGSITGLGTNVATALGNATNAANGLVQLAGTGKLPALDGSALTGITAGITSITAGTGLSGGTITTSGTISVNTSQNITTLSNLTSNGFVKTGGGAGTLSVDTTSYVPTTTTVAGTALSGNVTQDNITGLSSTGIIKRTAANTLAIATSNTDYLPATSPTISTGLTLSSAPVTRSGNVSSTAWTTSGLLWKSSGMTFTDTSSSGTVATAYTNLHGGNTIAASNATTFTNYYNTYFSDPAAGSNVTLTNKWSLGADSLSVGTSTPATINTSGVVTLSANVNSTSSSTGTLKVTGGIGVTGNIWGAVNIVATNYYDSSGNVLCMSGLTSYAGVSQYNTQIPTGAMTWGTGGTTAFMIVPVTDTFQFGITRAAPTAQTLRGPAGTGTDIGGGGLTIQGGASTGAGRGGYLATQTSQTSSTGSTTNSYTTRSYQSAKYVNLTDNSATLFANVALASSRIAGMALSCTVYGTDGTDYQARTSTVLVDAVNKGGTVTATLSETDNTTAASAGTLTVTYTAVANGNGVDIKCNAHSSLTLTTLRIKWAIVQLNSDDAGTVTAQ